MADLVEDFNEGRVQFAYLKVKDPNSGLPKNVLIAWCGGGVPERTKGYFTSHLAAVTKILHGYHVQITARSDTDVAPEAIIQKVADSSGSKYSAGSSAPAPAPIPRPPPGATKPVFTPTTSSAGRINPVLAARTRRGDEDEDGWGADAPQVTRTQLEKVQPAYKPTKVNMAELTGQKSAEPRSNAPSQSGADVVGGSYQPVGKVDIGAIRAAAKDKEDFRPTPVKGTYEPVGKVDIAAIRARAQPPKETEEPSASRGLADRSAAFSPPEQSERLTSMPKPKVANKFGSSASTFTGTKPPAPGGLGFDKPAAPPPPVVGAASRTFADQGGKTPAQLWAEKKGKRDAGGAPATVTPPMASPINSQKSGGEWKSGYTGKSWSVQAPGYGRSIPDQATGGSEAQEQAPTSPAGGVSAMKDRFKDAQPIAPAAPSAADRFGEPPQLPSSTRPQGGHELPGLPSRPPPAAEDDYEEERERSPSPVRVAVPVARGASPPPEPARDLPVRPKVEEPEPAQERGGYAAPAAAAGVAAGVGAGAGAAAVAAHETEEPAAAGGGPSAVALYDYEKSEDNEIELREDEYVVDIDMVDEDWWVGTSSQGERGLFPSNYVQLVGDDQQAQPEPVPEPAPAPAPVAQPAEEAAPSDGHTATALFDYEAAEDNGPSEPQYSSMWRYADFLL